MKWIGIALLGLFCAVPANAQTAGHDPNLCPRAPAGVNWTILRTPDMVLCRVLSETGEELFALTISRSSPFRPERVNRAEEGITADGIRFQWYRAPGGSPNQLIREALLEVGSNSVMHVFTRANDEVSLRHRQKLFESIAIGPEEF